MRLCNPSIESETERGFIAAKPGARLQKCVAKQIEVERSETETDGHKKVTEAQILVNAANDQRSIGQHWHEYNVAGKKMDHLDLGLGNDDLTSAVETLKNDLAECETWL